MTAEPTTLLPWLAERIEREANRRAQFDAPRLKAEQEYLARRRAQVQARLRAQVFDLEWLGEDQVLNDNNEIITRPSFCDDVETSPWL